MKLIFSKKGKEKMTSSSRFDLSILLLNEGESWVAQCLEYDIAAQGKTKDEAKKAFEKTLIGQLYLDIKYNKNPFEDVPRTPKMYWDLLEKSKERQERKPIYLPQNIPSMVAATANYLQVAPL